MRRRIADYDPLLGVDLSQLLITIAGFVIFFSVLIAVYNLLKSARKGEAAIPNPWRSRSPEFMLPSPIPVHNYARPFTVVGEPYDYGIPGAYVSIDQERMTSDTAEPESPAQSTPATSSAGSD